MEISSQPTDECVSKYNPKDGKETAAAEADAPTPVLQRIPPSEAGSRIIFRGLLIQSVVRFGSTLTPQSPESRKHKEANNLTGEAARLH